jgi:hypothetical protein
LGCVSIRGRNVPHLRGAGDFEALRTQVSGRRYSSTVAISISVVVDHSFRFFSYRTHASPLPLLDHLAQAVYVHGGESVPFSAPPAGRHQTGRAVPLHIPGECVVSLVMGILRHKEI